MPDRRPRASLEPVSVPVAFAAAVGIQLGITLLVVVGTRFLSRFTHLPQKAQAVEV